VRAQGVGAIYVARGLDPSLAKQDAQQVMAHDALGARARDEIGISETLRARPVQAALRSDASLGVGLGGHLKTGHTWTLQNRPTERNQNKSIYTLGDVV
jgi:VIT1/CCC1 family predicted Fe2+/Mn2+ transporter